MYPLILVCGYERRAASAQCRAFSEVAAAVAPAAATATAAAAADVLSLFLVAQYSTLGILHRELLQPDAGHSLRFDQSMMPVRPLTLLLT
jgi:hypothetical protein